MNHFLGRFHYVVFQLKKIISKTCQIGRTLVVLCPSTVPLSYPSHFMIFNYINLSLKCKWCVLNEEIQGENLWKIRQTTNEDFSLQEV
jgi:hypothetical protein